MMEKKKLKVEEANRKFEELWMITRKQDKLQLSIPAINQSVADGLSMTDHANAIILEISQWKGNITPLIEHGYLAEKINSLNRDWEWMQKHYEMRNTNPDIFQDTEILVGGKNKWKLKEVI
jgi:hypothetical protein